MARTNTVLIVADASPPGQIKLVEPIFTTKEAGRGAGLGLGIGYGIVADMGGTIAAAKLGDGAEIAITPPALDERARAA